jgi:hypothetical protein
MPGMPGIGIARAALFVCALSGCAGTQTFSGRSYLADNPQAYAGRVVGDGHCVRFVQAAAAAPRTSAWRAGAWVRGNTAIPPVKVQAIFLSMGKQNSSPPMIMFPSGAAPGSGRDQP